MRWLICGKINQANSGLIRGSYSLNMSAGRALRANWQTRKNEPLDCLVIDSFNSSGERVTAPVLSGVTALAAAAYLTAKELNSALPEVLLAGFDKFDDHSGGNADQEIYSYLESNIASLSGQGIFLCNLSGSGSAYNRLKEKLALMEQAPILIESGESILQNMLPESLPLYSLFLPSVSQLLSVIEQMGETENLNYISTNPLKIVENYYKTSKFNGHLLIKDAIDLIYKNGELQRAVDYPIVPNLKVVDGAGDTLMGEILGFLSSGYSISASCVLASLTNRFMAQLAQPTLKTQIAELVAYIPPAVQMAMQED